jgi:hypothetical protein
MAPGLKMVEVRTSQTKHLERMRQSPTFTPSETNLFDIK